MRQLIQPQRSSKLIPYIFSLWIKVNFSCYQMMSVRGGWSSCEPSERPAKRFFDRECRSISSRSVQCNVCLHHRHETSRCFIRTLLSAKRIYFITKNRNFAFLFLPSSSLSSFSFSFFQESRDTEIFQMIAFKNLPWIIQAIGYKISCTKIRRAESIFFINISDN